MRLSARKHARSGGIAGALVIFLTLAVAHGAMARWSDVSDQLLEVYGASAAAVKTISRGYEDGAWRPQEVMLRQHFVKMAVQAFGLAPVRPSAPSFSDVPADNPYYPYVETAATSGLTRGVGGGRFGLTREITRGEAAAIIARWVAQNDGVDLAASYAGQETPVPLQEFQDADTIPAGLLADMAYAVASGVIRGSAGSLQPSKTLTRIQGAVMLLRARDLLSAQAEDEEPADDISSTTSTSTTTSTTEATEESETTTTTTVSAPPPPPSITTTTSTGPTEPPSTTTTEVMPGKRVSGRVIAGPSNLAVDGAVITVSLTYGGAPIGLATSGPAGRYAIEAVQAELGTRVFVSAAKEGYNTTTVYGVLDEVDEEVDFGLLQTGPNAELDWSDRRLQPDSVFPSAPYFDGLLPD